jgi:hypothetical protein
VYITLARRARVATEIRINGLRRADHMWGPIDFDPALEDAALLIGPPGVATVPIRPRGPWSAAGRRTIVVGLPRGSLSQR